MHKMNYFVNDITKYSFYNEYVNFFKTIYTKKGGKMKKKYTIQIEKKAAEYIKHGLFLIIIALALIILRFNTASPDELFELKSNLSEILKVPLVSLVITIGGGLFFDYIIKKNNSNR